MQTLLFYMGAAARDMLFALPVMLTARALAYFLRHRRKLGAWHEAGVLVLWLYMAALLSQTVSFAHLFSGPWRVLGTVNLAPLATIKGMLAQGWNTYSLINLAGNVAMFAPLGLLLPLLYARATPLWRTALWGMLASLCIEVCQLFCARGADVDDVLLNTLGALLGYGLYAMARRRWPKGTARFRARGPQKQTHACNTPGAAV
nr:VanZ family protein [Maliibacterium massiliense]